MVNNESTIFLAPGGSKKGWPEDRKQKILRDKFIEKIKSYNYEEGDSPFSWVEVGYGEYGQKVLQGNCENKYDDREYYSYES